MNRVLWPAARIALNLIAIVAAVVVVLWVLGELRFVVVPTLLALLVATLLAPPTGWLRRRGMPSAIATLLTMAIAVLVLGGVIALIAPAFVGQFSELQDSVDTAIQEVARWLVEGPFELERSEIDSAVDDGLASLRDNAGGIGSGILSGASLVAEAIAGLLLMLVLVFFFVHDGSRIWSWLVSLAPSRHRDAIDDAGREAWETTGAYMRGVALIAVVDAVLIGIALAIIGVPLVVPLMVVVFLGAFVPLVGAFVTGGIAALVALVSNGPLDAAIVVAAIVAIQQIEGDLLYPNVVGRMIRLHPVAILLVVTAGTVVAGIVGALLSVPVAAAAWTAYTHFRGREEASSPAPG